MPAGAVDGDINLYADLLCDPCTALSDTRRNRTGSFWLPDFLALIGILSFADGSEVSRVLQVFSVGSSLFGVSGVGKRAVCITCQKLTTANKSPKKTILTIAITILRCIAG